MNTLAIPSITLALGLLLSFFAPSLHADSPQFRGPSGNGVFGEDLKIPMKWGPDTNMKWKTEIPGRGWSSPVIWDDRIFITTAVEKKSEEAEEQQTGRQGESTAGLERVFTCEVHCLDRGTGKTLWKRVAYEGHPRILAHRSNTYASETPVTDGKRLFVLFGSIGIFCYGLDGELVWMKDLGSQEMKRGWGTASSLALHDGLIFALFDSEEDSFLVALKTSDGEEAWRAERPNEPSNWSSPVIWKNEERTELVVGGEIVRSYDPATGNVFWELDTHGGETSASPSGNSERLVVGTEFSRARPGQPKRDGLLCSVRPGASGDITPKDGETSSPGLHWYRERGGPEMASPLIYKDYVYVVQRNNLLNCYNAKTGERTYEETRVEGGRPFWASPWAYDGHVYCLDEAGSTHVIEPGDEYKVVSVNKLDDQFWASAAVADGTLILRGVEGIYCIGQ